MSLVFSPDLTVPEFDPGSKDVQVWQDNLGRDCVYGLRAQPFNWLHFPGIGHFRFADREGEVAVVPSEGAPESEVIDTHYRSVLPTVLQHWGREVLHASAVMTSAGVVALCAQSETGKSTLAFALANRGNDLYADDALVLEPRDGRVVLSRLPFVIRLRKPSADHFGAAPREAVRVGRPQQELQEESAPLAALVLLERDEDTAFQGVDPGPAPRRAPGAAPSRSPGPDSQQALDPASQQPSAPYSWQAAGQSSVARMEQIAPSEAFSALLPHAYCFTLQMEDRKRQMMRNYLNICTLTPVYRLRFVPGLEHLDQILDELERVLKLD